MNAPTVWATMYGATLLQEKPLKQARPTVTAGLRCAPLSLAAT